MVPSIAEEMVINQEKKTEERDKVLKTVLSRIQCIHVA